ncbi:MAG: glycosyltransferase [Ignavibacteriaceae bacterium]
MKEKVLYIGMKYDYGNKSRGLSFEHRNFYHPLKSYCIKQGWDFAHYDFIDRGSTIGLDLMTEELYEFAKKEQPSHIFAVLFDFHKDPKHEVFKRLSELGITTIHWFCDDHWRYEKYSSKVAPNFDFICTTANSALQKYKQQNIFDKVIKTQWACNHELYIPYNVKKDIDVSFIGQPHGNRREVISSLLNKNINVEYFGFNWQNRPRLPFHQMVRMFSRSKINLNLSNSNDNLSQQIKGRNFEIPGTKSLLLTDKAENLEEYYENGKEIVIFNSTDELAEKIGYYLNHPGEGQKIAQNAYQRTIKEHTWFHRYDDIFNHIKGSSKKAVISNNPPAKEIKDLADNPVAKNREVSALSVKPSFSIIMANYNRGRYIAQAIESVLLQTFTDWELIIIDDCSTDNSIEVIKKYLTDNRIKLIRHNENKRYIVSLIEGINNVRSDYFGTLDSDDALLPNAIEVMYNAHKNNPTAGYIYSQFVYCNEELKPYEMGYCKSIPEGKTNLDSDVVSHFRTFKIDYYKKSAGYDTAFLHTEDKDISYKMEEVGALLFVNEPLYMYRVLNDSVSHNDEARKISLNTMNNAKVNAVKRRVAKSKTELSESIKNFENAGNKLYSREFKSAEKEIEKYRHSIDYTKFVRYDNRPKNLNNGVKLSVIIVAYNTKRLLLDCIRSVTDSYNNDCEVIVVDNGLNEEILPELIRLPILYVGLPHNFLLSEGRNIGVFFARGSIVSFLDDDALAHDNYAENIIRNFSDTDALALRGKVLPKSSSTNNRVAAHYNLGEDLLYIKYIDTEGNSAFLKEEYVKHSGMNPLLFGAEGFEYSYRIYNESGFGSFMYSPGVIIYHDYADNDNKLQTKFDRHKLMNDYLRWKYSDIEEFRIPYYKRHTGVDNSSALTKADRIITENDLYVINRHTANKVEIIGGADARLILDNNNTDQQLRVFYNAYSLENVNAIKPADAFWFTEPYTVIADNYKSDLLKYFPLLINWNRKFLKDKPNSVFVPHAHWSDEKDYEKLIHPGTNWNERKNEILFIGNPKSSQQECELYSLRVAAADWFHNNTDFEVSWYSRFPLDRPYYKGQTENKVGLIENAKFIFCPENTYDELHSWDYLTEKLFDGFAGKAVPLYMGCYNIDEYFSNNLYIDLRQYVKKNGKDIKVDFDQLYKKIKEFTESDYTAQQNAVAEFFRNNPEVFKDRTWDSVYQQVLKGYMNFFKRDTDIEVKNCNDNNIKKEIKRIEDNYIFTGDYYLKAEIEKLVKKYNIKSIVETGTSEGSSTKEMSSFVENVFSIEVVSETYQRAKERLKDIKNIKLFPGSSPDVMKEMLASVPRPVLFFLDAHWYDYWPILDELKVIKSFPDLKDSVIVVHDFYVPGKDFGYDSYGGQKLDYGYIEKELLEVNPNYKHYYSSKATGKRRGVIYIYPGEETPVVNNDEPFISVCIPTYNRAVFLKQAIDSALKQKGNFEIVVVDDGSTDNTGEIVKNFASSKINYIKKTNEGRPAARNMCVNEAKGDYLLWLDDDDLLADGLIESYSQVIKNDPSVDVVYGDPQSFDSDTGDDLQHFEPEDYTEKSSGLLSNIIQGKGITFGGSLIRKKLINEAGGFDNEFVRAQDNELWTRLAYKAKFHKLHRIIYYYRKHENNISMSGFIDRSYESLIIRKIVASYPLEKIYPSFNWENPAKARNKALYETAKGLMHFRDYFNSIKLIGSIEKKSDEVILMLFNAYLKSGKRVQAEAMIQSARGELKKKFKDIFGKYKKLWSLSKEKDLALVKSELESFISLEDYSFYPAFITGKIFEAFGDFKSAYLHLKNAVSYNPNDDDVFNDAMSAAKKVEKEKELSDMRNRMLKEFTFFDGQTINRGELVSVIMPSFNRPDKLKNAIESVLSQTYSNFELIIVKDGGKSVNKIVKSFNDNRIKLIDFDTNKGPSAARNAGIKSAKGKYIALLDDDDIFYPDHLETALDNLTDDIKVVYTDSVRCAYIKKGKKYELQDQTVPYSIDYNRNKLLIGNISPINCFVFEKSLLNKTGLFDESLQVLEDWEFWLRLSEAAIFKHIKKNTVQVNWYNDGSTLTSSKQEEFGKARNLIYKKYENEINAIPNMNEIIEEFKAIWSKDNPKDLPLVSIIALTYNQLEYTKAFVESVYKTTNVTFELILVDNNSSDETGKYLVELEKKRSNAKVIFNKENLGFPKGVNQGIKASSGKYILIANNDILVTENWLDRMLEIAESDPSAGLVCPISNAVSGVQLDKNAAYTTVEEMYKYAAKIRKENSGKMFFFPRVAFLCTLIKKQVIEKIGGLDERFSPGNFEDDDFCLRAQIAGYKTVIAQDVFIHHFGSKSFTAEGLEKYQEHLDKNKKIFKEKWNADPEEIWLQGKKIKQRSIMYPINNNQFIEMIERAKNLISDQEYHSALDSLYKALAVFDEQAARELNINRYDLLTLTGNVALLSNELEAAGECFEGALNLNPQSSQACMGLGEVFYKKDMLESAKTMFEWSVSYDPENLKAANSLREINSALGLNSADNSLHRQDKESDQASKKNENNANQMLSRAADSLLNKKYSEAKILIETAEGMFNGQLSNPVNSEFASAFYNLKGYIHLSLNDVASARGFFEKSLDLNKKSSQACTGLAEIILIEGLQKSKTMFEWGIKNNPANILAVEGLRKVNNLLNLPDNDISENLSSQSETSIVKLLDKAFKFFEEKKYNEALQVLLTAEEYLPENDMKIKSAVESLKGFSYLGLNNLEDAKGFFERALNDEPNSSDACAGLGEVFRLTGLEKEAKTMFEWALLYNPGNKFALVGLTKVNSLLGFENHHNSLIQEYH